MDIDKTAWKKAYRPFFSHAWFECFRLACIMSLPVGMIAIVSSLQLLYLAGIIYLIVVLYLLRFHILSILERYFNRYETRLVSVVGIEMDGWLGDYEKNDNRLIAQLYPKEMEVARNKFVCVDASGRKRHLRMIGSGRKMKLLRELLIIKKEKMNVTYGRYTGIIISLKFTNHLRDSVFYTNKLNRMF